MNNGRTVNPSQRQLKNNRMVYEIDKLKNKAHQLAILAPILMDESTWMVEPSIEFTVDSGKSSSPYRIDLYYPDIKLAIEVE